MIAVAIKERPILFKGPMVRAIRDGSKTQTRRAVKKAPHGLTQCHYNGGQWAIASDDNGGCTCKLYVCPYGQPGDRLWVRETFYAFGNWEQRPKEDAPEKLEWHFTDLTPQSGQHYQYEEPSENVGRRRGAAGRAKWWKRPSIFMPRAASRLLLEITAVRVERVQAISAADAVAEGIQESVVYDDCFPDDRDKAAIFYKDYITTYWGGFSDTTVPNPFDPEPPAPVESFRTLWESINGFQSWAANPEVDVVEFKVIPQ